MLELTVQEGLDRVITFPNDGDPLDFQMLQMFPATLQISQNHSSVSLTTGGEGPDSNERPLISFNRFIPLHVP